MAFQGLLPAFVGLFAVPSVVQNIVSRLEMPPQHVAATVDATPWLLTRGALAGVAGGLLAAFLPAVTGGIGALIAGHATAQRDDRLFLISQGSAKVAYYVGALLFLFVPGLNAVRGGMAAMLNSLWRVRTPQTFYAAVGATIITGVGGFLLLLQLSRLAARVVGTVRYRTISLATLIVQIAIVALFAGWPGLVVCAVAAGIGLIPNLWGSRRVNCMGVILLPVALEFSGVAGTVSGWLGLLR
jgi:putative membrane protein